MHRFVALNYSLPVDFLPPLEYIDPASPKYFPDSATPKFTNPPALTTHRFRSRTSLARLTSQRLHIALLAVANMEQGDALMPDNFDIDCSLLEDDWRFG
jgi:hypothetical protein